jgi:HlyD family secretion protein
VASSKIFRKVALDRLSSPEQLDQVMQITTAKGWISLATLGLLLMTTVGWSVLGSLSEKVTGRGILIRTGGVLEVVSSDSGRVTDIPVEVGDEIEEGQVIAWVAQPDLLDQLEERRAELATLRRENELNAAFMTNQARLQAERLRQQAAGLGQAIASDRDRLAALEQRIVAQERLVAKGLLARPTLLASHQDRDQTREKIALGQNQLRQIEVEELATRNQLDEALRTSRAAINTAEAELQQLERRFRASSQVVSPYTGRVLELMTEQGKLLDRGEPVLSLDLTGDSIQDLLAIVYVPSIHGKKVRPGMEIHLAPSTVAQEEYGMMIGRVTLVSDYPASSKGMLRVLKNSQLVQELSGGGAPYEVHAELIVDPSTPSLYRWTSSSGPPARIESGTVAAAFVTVETQRPISRVIPLLRNWSGI